MTRLLLEEDYEAYEDLEQHRLERLNTLLEIESDLVYHGHFILEDVRHMKVTERKFHVRYIMQRYEEMRKAREGS